MVFTSHSSLSARLILSHFFFSEKSFWFNMSRAQRNTCTDTASAFQHSRWSELINGAEASQRNLPKNSTPVNHSSCAEQIHSKMCCTYQGPCWGALRLWSSLPPLDRVPAHQGLKSKQCTPFILVMHWNKGWTNRSPLNLAQQDKRHTGHLILILARYLIRQNCWLGYSLLIKCQIHVHEMQVCLDWEWERYGSLNSWSQTGNSNLSIIMNSSWFNWPIFLSFNVCPCLRYQIKFHQTSLDP